MNSFSNVVFMALGKRERLSTEQRIDLWRRWKAGESSVGTLDEQE
jgi:hypothetical protein